MANDTKIAPSDQYILKIPFKMSDGKKYTVSLKDPKTDITLVQSQVFTDAVINSSLFVNREAEVSGIDTPYLERVNIIPVEAAI